MAVSMSALQRVLFDLEKSVPYLLADDIVILARGAGQRRRRDARSVDMLDVRFSLYGYMREAGQAGQRPF